MSDQVLITNPIHLLFTNLWISLEKEVSALRESHAKCATHETSAAIYAKELERSAAAYALDQIDVWRRGGKFS